MSVVATLKVVMLNVIILNVVAPSFIPRYVYLSLFDTCLIF
jgi:hypothetical protein